MVQPEEDITEKLILKKKILKRPALLVPPRVALTFIQYHRQCVSLSFQHIGHYFLTNLLC